MIAIDQPPNNGVTWHGGRHFDDASFGPVGLIRTDFVIIVAILLKFAVRCSDVLLRFLLLNQFLHTMKHVVCYFCSPPPSRYYGNKQRVSEVT